MNYLNLVIALIEAAEALLPDRGRGSEKLAWVKEVLFRLFPAIEQAWPAVAKLISIVIELKNARGEFAKG